MNARQVHAVLAAGVYNPQRIARWRRDPRLLVKLGIEPGTLDLAALWKFAGLTAKVRHNGVRRELPMTFRFMRFAGLEIEIFASYAASCGAAGRPFAPTNQGRIRDLAAFLERTLDLKRIDHSLLWDLIRHEQALAVLAHSASRPAALARARRALSSVPAAGSILIVRGEIILHRMGSDPRMIAQALSQAAPKLDRKRLAPRYYCYWRTDGEPAETRIVELDEFGYYVLSSIDGVRAVSEINIALGGSRRPSRNFLKALGQLASTGIIGFEQASRSRKK